MDAASGVAHSGAKRKRPVSDASRAHSKREEHDITAPRRKFGHKDESHARGRSHSAGKSAGNRQSRSDKDVDLGEKPVLDVSKYLRGDGNNAKVRIITDSLLRDQSALLKM